MAGTPKKGCLTILFPFLARKEDAPEAPQEINYPYRVSDRFLTPAEHSFYMVAKKVLGERFLLCPQVPLSAIFFITDKEDYMAAFGRIARKRVDFLVCDGITIKPLFAIELDDHSHQAQSRMTRDTFVEKVFESASMPLLRFQAQTGYVSAELEKAFVSALKRAGWAPQKAGDASAAVSAPAEAAAQPASTDAPRCPKCGSEMVLRVARSGPRQGERFYGCVNFPNCRTVLPADAVAE